MVILDPYLPDIIEGVVGRVNTFFESQDNPFSVAYDKGLYNQVGNDRDDSDLFIWLVMPFEEDRRKPEIYASVKPRLIIASTTEANYTMQQREDINFKPRLLPVYQKLLEEIEAEEMFGYPKSVDHSKKILPYWGGGDVNGTGTPNLWKRFVDCIDVNNINLEIQHNKNCTFFSNI